MDSSRESTNFGRYTPATFDFITAPERESLESSIKMLKQMGSGKRWNMEKGFGFIVPDDGGEDIFVHSTNIAKTAEGKRHFAREDSIM